MREEHSYAVYIMASRSGTLYIGVTNDIIRRTFEHKRGLGGLFTSRYHCTKLVYWEEFDDIVEAISREKILKRWLRSKKETLIRSINPLWFDLAITWEDPLGDYSDEEIRKRYRLR